MAKSNRFIVDFLFGAKKQKNFDKTFSAVSQSVKNLTKTVAGVAATYISAQALKDVSLSALDSASSLESYRSTLNVVMKDQKKAAQTMARHQVRRLPVVEAGRVVGMVSLGDLARCGKYEMEISRALTEISGNVRRP